MSRQTEKECWYCGEDHPTNECYYPKREGSLPEASGSAELSLQKENEALREALRIYREIFGKARVWVDLPSLNEGLNKMADKAEALIPPKH